MPLTYQSCTPGQRALGVALVGLRRHRLDEGKVNYLTELLDKFTGTPEEVLFSVAAEVDDQVEHGQMQQQPRYDELATMIAAARAVHNEIVALIGQRRQMPSTKPATRR
jgi:hypothetical protein